jgi:hypothetical protein
MQMWVKIRLGPRLRGAQRADDEVAEAAVALCDTADGLIDTREGGYVVLQSAEVEKSISARSAPLQAQLQDAGAGNDADLAAAAQALMALLGTLPIKITYLLWPGETRLL